MSHDGVSHVPVINGVKTMRLAMLEHALATLVFYKFNREYTAGALAVSVRTLRNYIHEMRAIGWDVPVYSQAGRPKRKFVADT